MGIAGAVARRVAAELGDPSAMGGDGPTLWDGDLPAPPGGWADPWLVGIVHELAAPAGDRRTRGAWYTPRPVVEGLLTLALPGPEPAGPANFSPGPPPVAAGVKRSLASGDPANFSPGPPPAAAGVKRSLGVTAGAGEPALVIDPTCGGGAFLLAALDRLVTVAGLAPADALARVAGMDIDPGAVQATRWSLALWWLARGGGGPMPAADVCRGDALARWPARWRRGPVLVIGNPPFATPLKNGTVPEAAARYRAGRADVLGPYADLAAIHLLRAVEQAPAGSTVALVQPQSVLAGRDTDGLRRYLAAAAPMRALWAAREAVFDAGVRACAVVLDVGGVAGPEVLIAHGPAVTLDGRMPRGSWGELAADALGAPALPSSLLPGIGTAGFCAPSASPVTPGVTRTGTRAGAGVGPAAERLGDLAVATAGFRDEHYALVAACREAAPGEDGDGRATARLVTVGAVEPLWTAWGTGPIRFGGRHWDRPVVDRHALAPAIAGWLDRQLRPKVLLATQTRLLEPCLDRHGVVAPATPLIAVHAPPDQLDRVAAVLLAPPVVAWAWRRWFGTAMAIDAVKLAARQVAEIPLPPDDDRWAEAAALLAAGHDGSRPGALRLAMAVARLMTDAYGASPAVLDWWCQRLPAGILEAGPEQVR